MEKEEERRLRRFSGLTLDDIMFKGTVKEFFKDASKRVREEKKEKKEVKDMGEKIKITEEMKKMCDQIRKINVMHRGKSDEEIIKLALKEMNRRNI